MLCGVIVTCSLFSFRGNSLSPRLSLFLAQKLSLLKKHQTHPGKRQNANIMDLQAMIDDAKARENNVFAKFQQYDADGSGAIDEVSANNNKKNCQKLKKLKQRIRLSRPVRQEIRLHAHAHTHIIPGKRR